MSRGHVQTRRWMLVGLAALSVACGGKLGANDKCENTTPQATATTTAAEARAPVPRLTTTPPIAAVSDLEHAFERASEAIAPSVVSISSVRTLGKHGTVAPFFGDDDPFREFFFRLPQPHGEVNAVGRVKHCLLGIGMGVEFTGFHGDGEQRLGHYLEVLNSVDMHHP